MGPTTGFVQLRCWEACTIIYGVLLYFNDGQVSASTGAQLFKINLAGTSSEVVSTANHSLLYPTCANMIQICQSHLAYVLETSQIPSFKPLLLQDLPMQQEQQMGPPHPHKIRKPCVHHTSITTHPRYIQRVPKQTTMSCPIALACCAMARNAAMSLRSWALLLGPLG